MPYIDKSKSDNWLTPKDLYEELDNEFYFNFDPCPAPLPKWDGLEIEWKESNFVNPPYSELAKWIEKCYQEYRKGKVVVLLMPSRTDTKAFHKYILPYAEIRFLKGRLKFDLNGKKAPAPFPSMLAIFKKL